MFRKVLIANRGTIACRVIRTLRKMGVASVAVYSEADRHSLHVDQADEAAFIGPSPASQSYLSISALLKAAAETGAEAIHPGYGFLSENASFAEACAKAGVVFIGPTPQQMRDFGLKHTAREIAAKNGVPMLPGTGVLKDVHAAVKAAEAIGYPTMLKSTAGGGGIGVRLCASAAELRDAYEAVSRQSQASFGSSNLYLERFVTAARHIEVQIFGDGRGSVIALGERDCSVQRRNQKVIEETPAPGLSDDVRKQLLETAVRLGKAVQYQSAGTVEFIYDNSRGDFYFLEVNTRLQVEHGVTEEVTGVDLVEWMVKQAAGEMPALTSLQIRPTGSSIQVRVYAEDPARNFQPSAGRLLHVRWPESARVETWVESGTEVTPFYDPMMAKVIVRGADRREAFERMRDALSRTELFGIETNLPYLQQICESTQFGAGGVTTSFLKDFPYTRHAIDVLEPGTQTTIQDYPGRLGYWHVGVPPSGPMDTLAFRLANRLVGNQEDAAGLEITLTGPSLRFTAETTIALTGADFGARLDGRPLPRWQAVAVREDSLLELGAAQSCGARAYVAVAGGIDTPAYLGSRSTFILGKFGGQGRALRAGDVLHIKKNDSVRHQCYKLPACTIPKYNREWEIGVLYGPHGSPDFFTPQDIEMFFSTAWKVHYNSDRTGVRLIGPKPRWARKDGGEAGLHPSNIHDNAYAIGTVDFTGDMPVILGPDGPSLGGFVCPATIVEA
ncbi:MAG TPA: 5-oxoprolinase/urea amidolyase family protein, partial [Dongiaceae bacterium]|nr:5-oxoprolinase/urea amidolyase family protein [Dongiaceae bacterium]